MSDNESPFHRGEKEIQARLGIQEKMEAAGRRMIHASLPQQHRDFYSQLPFLLVGTADEAGEDPTLVKMLEMPDYQARIERAVLLKVQAFDWNCPQHITPRYTVNELEQMTGSGP